jgi:hypothetical protein
MHENSHFAVHRGGATAGAAGTPPGREYQEMWFSLARLPWASLVIVPADHGGSASEVALALAEVGSRLRDTPVTAIVVNRMDYASARALAEMQPRLQGGGQWLASRSPTLEVEARPVEPVAGPPNGDVHLAAPLPPVGRAIIAIQPIVDEPLGVAIAQAADAAVLCVEIGKTRIPAARRTIGLIGAERVVGVVLVR